MKGALSQTVPYCIGNLEIESHLSSILTEVPYCIGNLEIEE